jgi:cytochrome c peroxidase
MKNRIRLLVISTVLLSTSALAGDLQSFKRPLEIPFDQDKPYSLQLATIGKMLFFDPRLSGARNFTCASCHNPSFGFEAPVETSVGAANTPLGRQAPTVLNAAWISPLFWDGRAATLEDQAAGPITAAVEMNGDFHQIVQDLKDVPDYVAWFDEIFPGEGITEGNILSAIATYERTVVSPWSPFDRWVDGDPQAVSESAKRGFELFTGKAHCADCHSGWNFTDNQFHDIGLDTEDIGRAAIDDGDPKNMHAFKTPGLRNTLYRAPYMHNGKTSSIKGVIFHYISGGIKRPSLSEKMRPLDLSEQDISDLMAFLKTLTAEQQDLALPTLPN